LCSAGLTGRHISLLIAHHGNEEVGDAGRANVAKRRELLAIDMIGLQIE
jgi:hypothetical protein